MSCCICDPIWASVADPEPCGQYVETDHDYCGRCGHEPECHRKEDRSRLVGADEYRERVEAEGQQRLPGGGGR